MGDDATPREVALARLMQLAAYIFAEIRRPSEDPPIKIPWSRPERFLRMLCIVNELVELCQEPEATVSYRGVYYRHAGIFDHQEQSNYWINKVCSQIGFPKEALGIIPAAKGMVWSRQWLVVDNDLLDSPTMIDSVIADKATLEGATQAAPRIYVIEKHTCFGAFQAYLAQRPEPSILVTGRGFPDAATARFVHRLAEVFPTAHWGYAGDFDPHGILIYHQYRIPALRWLGVTREMAEDVDDEHKLDLTDRDRRLLMSSSLTESELAEAVIELDYKCEMDIFHPADFRF